MLKSARRMWPDGKDEDHAVMEVAFDETDIAEARKVADAKVNHINAHNPGGVLRDPKVIHSRLIAGKLADSAVFALLQHRIAKLPSSQGLSLTEYDKTRSDGFEKPDPYDLLLRRAGQASPETVEIRSSFAYKLAPVENIIQKLSIYGWYRSENKPDEPHRDWYWQVIYYLRPENIPQTTDLDIGIFEEALAAGWVTAYVVGGASRDLLQKKGGNRGKDQDGALYRAIYPIRSGLDCAQMLTAMQL